MTSCRRTRRLVIILAEIDGGGLNQAVIGIEETRASCRRRSTGLARRRRVGGRAR